MIFGVIQGEKQVVEKGIVEKKMNSSVSERNL
jgi:hypothetical protein